MIRNYITLLLFLPCIFGRVAVAPNGKTIIKSSSNGNVNIEGDLVVDGKSLQSFLDGASSSTRQLNQLMLGRLNLMRLQGFPSISSPTGSALFFFEGKVFLALSSSTEVQFYEFDMITNRFLFIKSEVGFTDITGLSVSDGSNIMIVNGKRTSGGDNQVVLIEITAGFPARELTRRKPTSCAFASSFFVCTRDDANMTAFNNAGDVGNVFGNVVCTSVTYFLHNGENHFIAVSLNIVQVWVLPTREIQNLKQTINATGAVHTTSFKADGIQYLVVAQSEAFSGYNRSWVYRMNDNGTFEQGTQLLFTSTPVYFNAFEFFGDFFLAAIETSRVSIWKWNRNFAEFFEITSIPISNAKSVTIIKQGNDPNPRYFMHIAGQITNPSPPVSYVYDLTPFHSMFSN